MKKYYNFELSGNYSYYHFEILADKIELEKINSIIESESIQEVA